MALISFHTYSTLKNKLEKRVRSLLNTNDLDGDWLNPAPNLDAAENRCRHALETAPGRTTQLKYSNPLKIIREKDSVYIVRTGILTNKEDKLFGFELIKTQIIKNAMTDFKMVPLADIKPDPNQPRKYYDEAAMEELTASIKEKGVLQPTLLRPIGSSEAYLKIDPAAPVNAETRRKVGYTGPVYLMVCGERRYRASIAAGLAEIPAIIRELTDEEALELQIIENLQRKDVHPMEEAVAFKSLQDKKGWTVTEIANRVGKKDYYIKQRLRLSDLTADWQKVFYHNALTISDALKVAMLSVADQKELLSEEKITKEDLKHGGFKVEFNSWRLNKYKGELLNAAFDTKDTSLIKKMGSCTNCKFNTAFALLLPEMDAVPRCTNTSCFKEKTEKSFEIRLQEALTDPAMLFVNTDYTDHKPEISKLTKVHNIEVLQYGSFSQLNMPDPPDFEDWSDDYGDEYPNEKERTAAWNKELVDFEKKRLEYEAKIASGRYKKALVVVGDDKGKYIYLQLGKKKAGSEKPVKTSKQVQEDIKEGSATLADVNTEISRINENLEKAAKLDGEKVHFRIMADYKKHPALITPSEELNQIERFCLHWFILNHLNISCSEVDDDEYKQFGLSEEMEFDTDVRDEWETAWKHLTNITSEAIAGLFRKLMADQFASKSPRGWSSEVNKAFVMRKMAEALGDIPIDAYEEEQNEIAEKRLKKAQKRLAELEVLQKELEEAKSAKKTSKNAKKAATK